MLDERAGERLVERARRQRHPSRIGRTGLLAGGILYDRIGVDVEAGEWMRLEPAVGARRTALGLSPIDAQRQRRRLDERTGALRRLFSRTERHASLRHAVIVGNVEREREGAGAIDRERPARDGRRPVLDHRDRIFLAAIGMRDDERRIAVEHGFVAADRLVSFCRSVLLLGSERRGVPIGFQADLRGLFRDDANGELAPFRDADRFRRALAGPARQEDRRLPGIGRRVDPGIDASRDRLRAKGERRECFLDPGHPFAPGDREGEHQQHRNGEPQRIRVFGGHFRAGRAGLEVLQGGVEPGLVGGPQSARGWIVGHGRDPVRQATGRAMRQPGPHLDAAHRFQPAGPGDPGEADKAHKKRQPKQPEHAEAQPVAAEPPEPEPGEDDE